MDSAALARISCSPISPPPSVFPCASNWFSALLALFALDFDLDLDEDFFVGGALGVGRTSVDSLSGFHTPFPITELAWVGRVTVDPTMGLITLVTVVIALEVAPWGLGQIAR